VIFRQLATSAGAVCLFSFSVTSSKLFELRKVLGALFNEFCRARKKEIISEGSFADEAVVAFFVTFFSIKESRSEDL